MKYYTIFIFIISCVITSNAQVNKIHASQLDINTVRDSIESVSTTIQKIEGINYTSIEIGDYRDLTFEVPSTSDNNETISFPISFSAIPKDWDITVVLKNSTAIASHGAYISNSATTSSIIVNRADSVNNSDTPFWLVRIRGLK